MLLCSKISKTEANGLPCSWCRRPMELDHSLLAPTRDHRIPRAHGGRETFWACNQCNNIKGDMSPEEWDLFRFSNPRYWLMTKNEIRLAIKKKNPSKKPWRRRVRYVSQVVVPPELIYGDRVYRCGDDAPRPPMAEALAPLTI